VSTPFDRQWSARHDGLDPYSVPFVAGWVRVMSVLSRPLAALRIPALALTIAGALCAVDAVLLADRLPFVSAALIVASVLFDGVDGAVASLSGRPTRLGAIADFVADRVSDAAFVAVIWHCGAPWWLAAAALLLTVVHEGSRQARGGLWRTRITVAERPSRTICAVAAAMSAGVATSLGSSATWTATVCVAVWIGLGAVGLGQLFSSPA
jgi:phosphatidylglycerophosphate synthase